MPPTFLPLGGQSDDPCMDSSRAVSSADPFGGPVTGGARDLHQSTSFRGGEPFGPLMTDMGAFLGGRPCR